MTEKSLGCTEELILPRNSSEGLDTWPVPVTKSRIDEGTLGKKTNDGDFHEENDDSPVDLWWFMMIYDEFWWFMMIYDYLWWVLMIYDDLWWVLMIYDDSPVDLWWFMMMYDDLWWFMMIYGYLISTKSTYPSDSAIIWNSCCDLRGRESLGWCLAARGNYPRHYCLRCVDYYILYTHIYII